MTKVSDRNLQAHRSRQAPANALGSAIVVDIGSYELPCVYLTFLIFIPFVFLHLIFDLLLSCEDTRSSADMQRMHIHVQCSPRWWASRCIRSL